MPACTRETVQWPLILERARAGSSSSSSGSEFSSPSRPASPADWTPAPEPFLSRLLGWYPALVLRLAKQMLSLAIYLAWNKIFISTGLWILDCILHVPLMIFKWILSIVYGSRGLGRTVLITGSSIETLQIARNFYQSGARVIIVEHDDKFGLVRFSTVVDKFYSVPAPQKYPQEYIRELCSIAERENASYFVPSSTSHPTHFDALAKPHLEKLGVKCVCPGVKEVWLMDDPASMLQLCHDAGLKTPVNIRVTSPSQLSSLYEEGQLRRARHVLYNAGPIAARDVQNELELPQTRRGFRRLVETKPKFLFYLSASRPALLVQIPEGERLVTCTTVRDGQVVANITCRAPLPDDRSPVFEPFKRDDVDSWLESLFTALPPSRVFSGHLTFTLIATRDGIVPINCRLGVSLPYLCYTSQQPRVLMRPCKHNHKAPNINREDLVLKNGCYWLHESLLHAARTPSFLSICNLISTILKKKEVLFITWDPIPSLVFYMLQAPARAAHRLLQGSHRTNNKHTVHFSSPERKSIELTSQFFKEISSDVCVHKNGNLNHVNSNSYTQNGQYLNGHSLNNQSLINGSKGNVFVNGNKKFTGDHHSVTNGFTTNGVM